ncbi:MAG: hypothetical protein D6816_18885 [Bacteroidetes bacterium]|nr:MAG: hypothetical protein D6816_18885 [Bacteroidota bacterium]
MKKLIYALCFSGLMAGFGCQNESTVSTTEESKTAAIDMEFAKLFDTVNVVKMHVFSGDESANYPYNGNAIEGDHLALLADDLKPADGGQVFACYWLENDDSYMLRIKNGDAASSLVLARYNPSSGKLEKVSDLAAYTCNESECQQRDAWFIDLDDDRDLELITLDMTLDADGNKVSETFTVMARDEKGMFSKADEQLAALAPQDRYVPSSHR